MILDIMLALLLPLLLPGIQSRVLVIAIGSIVYVAHNMVPVVFACFRLRDPRSVGACKISDYAPVWNKIRIRSSDKPHGFYSFQCGVHSATQVTSGSRNSEDGVSCYFHRIDGSD